MKHATIAIAILFALPASGQEVISRARSILNAGGMFYVLDSVLYDNGQALPDLQVSRRLVGDTAQLARHIRGQSISIQEQIAKEVAEAMARNRANTDFLDYRAIYNQVTGREMFEDIEEELYQDYAGQYQVFDLAADSSFSARLVRFGPNNRFRLQHEQTGQRWTVLPLSRENFRLMGWNGEDIDLYWDREQRKGRIRIFQEPRRISGGPVVRIAKIQSQ